MINVWSVIWIVRINQAHIHVQFVAYFHPYVVRENIKSKEFPWRCFGAEIAMRVAFLTSNAIFWFCLYSLHRHKRHLLLLEEELRKSVAWTRALALWDHATAFRRARAVFAFPRSVFVSADDETEYKFPRRACWKWSNIQHLSLAWRRVIRLIRCPGIPALSYAC